MAMNYTSSGPVGGVAFAVKQANQLNNISLSSWTTLTLDTEIFDTSSNWASNAFTAPVTGKYQFNLNIRWEQIDSAHSGLYSRVVTSNRSYHIWMRPDQVIRVDSSFTMFVGALADMDASDTAYADVYTEGGTSQTDVEISQTYLTGHLAA